MTALHEIKKELLSLADADTAIHSQRFFKTGKGEYGEGDVFLGIRVPTLRKLAKKYNQLSLKNIQSLLKSKCHEQRLLSVIMLTEKYKKADLQTANLIYSIYISNTKYINNWDIVDISAPTIIGSYLYNKNREILYTLCKSADLWERRIAIIPTFHFIRNNDFDDCLKITQLLLNDEHDLIHKACGWMLREIGKRELVIEEEFIIKYASDMPRTMLRYALEKFSLTKRKEYMAIKQR